MKKFLPLVVFFFALLLFFFAFIERSSADELDDITKKISDLTSALNQSKVATAPLESQLNSLQKQIADIRSRVATIEQDIVVKRQHIDNGYKDMEAKQKVLNITIRDYYIKSYYDSPLVTFLSGSSASDVTQALAYQKAATDQDKLIITNMALTIQDLEEKKKALEDEEKRLAAIKVTLDQQSAQLDKVVQGAKQYQAQLSGQIAALSAQQQQLLAAKQASLNIPQSAYTTQGGCSDDRGVDPGFSPRFALFTYGVPNRVGLNQYGAKGRAEAGQNAETILSAYYSADLNKSYDSGINIHVTGTNEYGQSFDTTWNIEDYVKHIYEMPTSWSMEALKAQAVAARSYALAATNNGASSICPSQSCQVVKQEINSDTWQQAVDATKGWVLTSGGQPIKAWFSSTHGGYVFTSNEIGWNGTSFTKHATDTTTGSAGGFADLQANAYDKASPWFYCDWGTRAQYGKTAWLRTEELADIVNVISLLQLDPGLKEHLYQTDKPNPAGTDTWDSGRVKQELKNRGGTPFTSITDSSVSADFGGGRVTTITFTGDAGSKSFPGDLFKTYFNIRAPANINIVGPLYNVEKR